MPNCSATWPTVKAASAGPVVIAVTSLLCGLTSREGQGQAFLLTLFRTVPFLAVAFLAVAFLAVALLAVVFLAARLRVTGPRARFSARSSAPRSGVIVSGASSLRKVALVSPSVT